jgi:hypothetical protein
MIRRTPGANLDTRVEPPRRDDYDTLGIRVARVEGDVSDIKTVLAELKMLMVRIDTRIETQFPYLATKAEIAELEAHMERRFGEVERRFGAQECRLTVLPTKTYMWGILGVLLTAYACGLAALAVLK